MAALVTSQIICISTTSPDVATHQSVCEEPYRILGLLSQPPLRIHAEGEEEDAAFLEPFRVLLRLGRVYVSDDLVDRFSLVSDTAHSADEHVDGEPLPFHTTSDIARPVVAGQLTLCLDRNAGHQTHRVGRHCRVELLRKVFEERGGHAPRATLAKNIVPPYPNRGLHRTPSSIFFVSKAAPCRTTNTRIQFQGRVEMYKIYYIGTAIVIVILRRRYYIVIQRKF